jgi:hypothetical protein
MILVLSECGPLNEGIAMVFSKANAGCGRFTAAGQLDWLRRQDRRHESYAITPTIIPNSP